MFLFCSPNVNGQWGIRLPIMQQKNKSTSEKQKNILLPGKRHCWKERRKIGEYCTRTSLKSVRGSTACPTDSSEDTGHSMFETKHSDRNTCACHPHKYQNLLIDSLANGDMVPTKSLSPLLSSITCSKEDKRCMRRECTECCFDEVQFADHNPNGKATWEHWQRECRSWW